VEFVRKLVSRTSTTGSGGIASLDHEIGNHAVERDVVIISPAGKIEEIRTGERSLGRVKRGFDVSGGGVNGDFDVGHGPQVTPKPLPWQLLPTQKIHRQGPDLRAVQRMRGECVENE